MLNALAQFEATIRDARKMAALHSYLEGHVHVPVEFDDLLRAQLMYSMSALDKLMHDLIKIGMVSIYVGARAPTPKFLSEGMPIELHLALTSATVPPKEYIFEQAVIKKLKILSFQDPAKISDGLSYIWNEGQKWKKIADELELPEDEAKTRMKLISGRRNSIVHESDIDPVRWLKNPIDKVEVDDASGFLLRCGQAITKLVM